MKKRRRQPPRPTTYTLLDELTASPTEPMPAEFRRHQLTRMWGGLASMETASAPTIDDWRVCSDAVNLMETLIEQGIVEDTEKLLPDAVAALALAGKRHQAGKQIRLDGAGIRAVRSLLENYAELLDVLPARVMIRCHRLTERRIQDIFTGRRRPHDIEVMDL